MARKQAQGQAEEMLRLDAEARAEAAQATVRSQKRELAKLQKAYGHALEFNDDLARAVQEAGPVRIPAWRRQSAAKPEVGLNVSLGDWHIGEVISAEETDGFNAFGWEIAQQRCAVLMDKLAAWLVGARAAYTINRVWVQVLADMINGDIHPQEYWPTQEFPVPVQTANAGRLLAEVLLRLCGMVRHVTVDLIGADNHARRTHRPQHKEAARNSYNYLIYELVATALRAQKNATMKLHLPLRAEIVIEGRRVLIEHGHTIRAWMGIPFYGIERTEGREARKRMKRGRPYTHHIIGHWHMPAEMPGLSINGSLCGASEYDAAAGRFADPSQTTCLIHPRHGLFNRVAWNLAEED